MGATTCLMVDVLFHGLGLCVCISLTPSSLSARLFQKLHYRIAMGSCGILCALQQKKKKNDVIIWDQDIGGQVDEMDLQDALAMIDEETNLFEVDIEVY